MGFNRRRLAVIKTCIAAAIATAAAAWGARGAEDLAGPLRVLAARAKQGVSVAAAAARAGVPLVRGQVHAEVWLRDGADPSVLRRAGATVRYTAGRRADVLVPPSRLLDLASLAEVAQVAPAISMVPLQFGYGNTVSQAVQLINASVFQYNGVDGTGATVAVIDLGFAGWASAEIPGNPQPIVLRADGNNSATAHGTAVAEIIADVAPGARFQLYAVDTPESVVQALTQIASAGDVQIVCLPMGLVEGPFDGSHIVSRAVATARRAGVLVVVAAGNFAQRHWEGPFTDRDRDGFCEFRSGDESIDLVLPAGPFRAYLSWYQTAGEKTDQDYDLVLYDSTGSEVARSAYTQNGDDAPREVLLADLPAGSYSLRIQAVAAAGADYMQLFVPDIDIEANLQVRDHSISIPGEADEA
ncbi:MAG: hypothetical protein H5T86_10200, partial [Armatimonadetes bacterium]|nr:hypothetical protein [Armatimonadota bacterium]